MDHQENRNIVPYELNGIIIDSSKLSDLRLRLENVLKERSCSKQIITFNTDFLRLTYRDKEFKSICCNSSIVVPDGIGITLLIRIKYGYKLKRVTGFDLFETCFDLAAKHSLKVALVGSSKATLEKLNIIIKCRWPNVSIKYLSPEMNFEIKPGINNRIVNEIKDFKPDILIVALGCPRQEKWINSFKDEIGATINIGVGAVFEYISGTKHRAPLFLQNIGLEWFWRFLLEPGRLGHRYFLQDLPFFISKLIRIIFHLDRI